MYRLINNLFSFINNKSPILFQSPGRNSFGNGSEEIFFGLLKAQKENKKVLFLYPRLKLFGRSFSLANRELFHLRSDHLVSNDSLLSIIGGCFLSIYIMILWIIDWFRNLIIFKFINSKDKAVNHGYIVSQIGRKDLWKPYGAKTFSWNLVYNLKWQEQFENYIPPKISIDKNIEAEKIRIKMGIPISDWFVCIHVGEQNPPTPRNASIENYIETIKYITRTGGWVVRIGDSSMTPLPKMDKVIDFSHSLFKSELMDLYLINECRFFIGLGSGPTFVATLFDKPQVLVNMNDWSMGVPLKKGGLVLIKHVFSKSKNKFLSVKEILNEPYDVTVFGKSSKEYILYENTPEEIRTAIEEYILNLDKIKFSTLQKKFNRNREEAIDRWINSGEPKWYGVPTREIYLNQYRIASRKEIEGTMSNKYLEENWEIDNYKIK